MHMCTQTCKGEFLAIAQLDSRSHCLFKLFQQWHMACKSESETHKILEDERAILLR